MFKVIGIFLMFLSAYSLQQGFELTLVLWFLFGLFLVFSQAIGGHLLFIQREKVRARYRRGAGSK
jgi:hypothetical protein